MTRSVQPEEESIQPSLTGVTEQGREPALSEEILLSPLSEDSVYNHVDIFRESKKYRITWIDGFQASYDRLYSIIARPDDGVQQYVYPFILGESLRTILEKHRDNNDSLVHFKSYKYYHYDCYAAIFREKGPEWKITYGARKGDHDNLLDKFTSQGFLPVNVSVVTGVREAGKDTLYNVLYHKKPVGYYYIRTVLPNSEYNDLFNVKVEDLLGPPHKGSFFPVDIDTHWRKGKGRRFSVIWHSKPGFNHVIGRHGISGLIFNDLRTAWVANGPYITKAFTTYYRSNNKPGLDWEEVIYGALWARN